VGVAAGAQAAITREATASKIVNIEKRFIFSPFLFLKLSIVCTGFAKILSLFYPLCPDCQYTRILSNKTLISPYPSTGTRLICQFFGIWVGKSPVNQGNSSLYQTFASQMEKHLNQSQRTIKD
jgi:hypothetical protein